MQAFEHFGVVRLQEAGGELVQQAADVVGRTHEQFGIGLLETHRALGTLQGVFQGPRQRRQEIGRAHV